jgi:hypothetical protein
MAGMARQWAIQGRCRFCVAPAEDFLGWVLRRYPGPVAWISVQFPTPYKFETRAAAAAVAGHKEKGGKQGKGKEKGSAAGGKNEQLPSGGSSGSEAESDDAGGFMVTMRLMHLCVDISVRKGCSSGVEGAGGGGGKRRCSVYFQSNVEDVAVTLRSRFEEVLRQKDIPINTSVSKKNTSSKCSQSASHLKEFYSKDNNRSLFPHDVFSDQDSLTRPVLRAGQVSSLDGLEVDGGDADNANVPRRQKQWIADGGERADPAGEEGEHFV